MHALQKRRNAGICNFNIFGDNLFLRLLIVWMHTAHFGTEDGNVFKYRFLFERTGHLYKKYRARVAELKKSFEDTKGDIKPEPGPSAPATGWQASSLFFVTPCVKLCI